MQQTTFMQWVQLKLTAVFLKTTVTVDAESETEMFYDIQGMSWESSDILNAKIL